MPFIEPTPHNQELDLPDRLTTLTMNYLWRRFIADALTEYFQRAIPAPGTSPDVDQTWINFHNLILDLYDSEIGINALRIATIHAKETQAYPVLSTSRVIFDIAQGPYFYDPDGLFIAADNVFRAQEAGVYALMVHLDVAEADVGYYLGIRRVGDADWYAQVQVEGDTDGGGLTTCFALIVAAIADEFEVTITTPTFSVICVYGYAAFVRLGGL